MADGVVRLDSGQVRQILEARRSAERLEAQLQRMDDGGGGGIGSGILDRLARFEAFAGQAIKAAQFAVRAAERMERFLALSGLSSSTLATIRENASAVQGASGGAQLAAPIGLATAPLFAAMLRLNPVVGSVLAGTMTVMGTVVGAYYGSQVPKMRLEGERRVLEIQNEQVRADVVLKRQVQEFVARRAADRTVAQTSAQLQAAFRRVRRGAIR